MIVVYTVQAGHGDELLLVTMEDFSPVEKQSTLEVLQEPRESFLPSDTRLESEETGRSMLKERANQYDTSNGARNDGVEGLV